VRRLSLAVPLLLTVTVLATHPAPVGASVIAHPSIVSPNPAGFTPNIMNGRVNVMIVVGNRVFVGGTFTTVRNAGSSTDITRNYILAYDVTTGVVSSSFRPAVAGAVEALAPSADGTSIYVGGSFSRANGNTAYARLVRVDASTGATITSFLPKPNRPVLDLIQRGGRLYASGEFTQIGGRSRSGLALLNPTTGAADQTLNLPFTDPWVSPKPGVASPMRVWRMDITPDGSRLIATGNFSRVASAPRDQIAILDVNDNPVSLDPWSTTFFRFTDPNNPDTLTNNWCSQTFPHYIRDLDVSPDGSYVAIVTTGANFPGHPSCDSVSRWSLTTSGPDQHPDWVANSGGDSFHSVLATGAAIYAGGHQQWMNNPYNPNTCGKCTGPWPGGVARKGFSAHDPANGLPFSWDPVRNPRGKGVLAMVATPNGFFFGSDTDTIYGETHRKNGFMPLAGGVTVPSATDYGLPGGFFSVGQSGTPSQLLRRQSTGTAFDPPVQRAASVDWSDVRGSFVLNGWLYTGMANGTLVRRAFDGVTAGAASVVDLHGLDQALDPSFVIRGTSTPIPPLSDHLASCTGMFFHKGFLYYTVHGDPRLYARAFTQESQIVGAPLLVPSTGDGVDWAKVRGMTLASGALYFALSDGTLNTVAWSGDPFGAGHPTGSVTTITGANVDGIDWASSGMFVFPS
jgi:hypothetical protein